MTVTEEPNLKALALLEETGNLTRMGLRVPAHCTFDQYEAMGNLFGSWNEGLKWAMGDWLAAGETLFGEEAYQASDALGISVISRQQYVNVAIRIPLERRRASLTWSHHRTVSAMDVEDQERWLDAAQKNGWTKGQMEEAIKGMPSDPPGMEPPPNEPFGDQMVVERVVAAAERVWVAAQLTDAEHYIVDAGPMNDLAEALGIDV